jgi:exonuclease SbcD
MKFLHTSDWHIGRTIRGKSRWDEQECALQQVLAHAREQQVDCLLVSGDVFDSSAPSPDSEELAYSFFRELHGIGVPAVIIAGNHDHPIRFDAISHLLRALKIHVLGEPVEGDAGGRIEMESRDGTETAVIAALPWVSEQRAVAFAKLRENTSAPLAQYAECVSDMMRNLAAAFRPDACNLMLAHLLVDDAMIGPGGGERELHMAMGIYGVRGQMLPTSPQYLALGHVHKAQAVRKSPAAWYSGSLLQLDFGEREQGKSINLVEVHPRLPAEVAQLPITGGKPLYDIGTPARGIALNDVPSYAGKFPDAWLRVFVEVDMPVANLPALVRESLPNAVHIERVRTGAASEDDRPSMAGLGPIEMFATFYRSELGRAREPAKPTLDLFRQLMEEETRASPEA